MKDRKRLRYEEHFHTYTCTPKCLMTIRVYFKKSNDLLTSQLQGPLLLTYNLQSTCPAAQPRYDELISEPGKISGLH